MTMAARGALRRLRSAASELTGKPMPAGPAPAAPNGGDDRRRRIKEIHARLRGAGRSAVPARPQLRVAVAASPRLTRALAWEWNQVGLEPGSGPEQLETSGAELLLIEVRAGRVPGWGPVDDAAVKLAVAAHRCEIPTVVWLTAAPGNPDIGAALVPLVSAVFVADSASLPAWQKRWPDTIVEELAPAAAPMLHSPATAGAGRQRIGDAAIVVDDTALHETSRAGMVNLVGPALDMKTLTDVHLWRLQWEAGKAPSTPLLPAPVRRAFAVGVVEELSEPVVDHYRVMIDAARCSPSSSWSVLEAGAAQTAVVTLPGYHATLPADLQEHVGTGSDSRAFNREIAARLNQPELRDREALRLHRAVLSGHTFGHRVDAVLRALGRPVPAVDRSVSIVVPTNREHEIDNVFANVARQAHDDIELILVLHGLRSDHADLRARAAEQGIDRFQVIQADPGDRLGALMNAGIDAAGGRYLAKMDDDNFYGRHYLTDLLNAFTSTNAEIVGKWAHYVWLRSTNAVLLRYPSFENRHHRLVQGGSIVAERELAADLRFSDIPRAVDTDFLNRAWAAGAKTYSADRFNFISIRAADHEQHTWKVTDTEMMLGEADLAFYGDPRLHVEV